MNQGGDYFGKQPGNGVPLGSVEFLQTKPAPYTAQSLSVPQYGTQNFPVTVSRQSLAVSQSAVLVHRFVQKPLHIAEVHWLAAVQASPISRFRAVWQVCPKRAQVKPLQQVLEFAQDLNRLVQGGLPQSAADAWQLMSFAQQNGEEVGQQLPGMASPQSTGASFGQTRGSPHLPSLHTRPSQQSAV